MLSAYRKVEGVENRLAASTNMTNTCKLLFRCWRLPSPFRARALASTARLRDAFSAASSDSGLRPTRRRFQNRVGWMGVSAPGGPLALLMRNRSAGASGGGGTGPISAILVPPDVEPPEHQA